MGTTSTSMSTSCRLTSSQRRELDSFARDEADLFEVNRNFEAHKVEASTPIVGNISHVYLFHVDRAPDSVPDSSPDFD